MRSFLALVACLIAFGCGNGNKAPETNKPEPAIKARSTISAPAKVDPPDFEVQTALRMIRKGDEVHIGDTIDSALRAFAEEKNAYKVNEMPPGWKDPAYTCQGWDNGTTGFAAIVYTEKVTLALYHEDKGDEARLQEILEVYQRMVPGAATKVTGSRVRYWFWEEQSQRLMICAVQTPDGLNITISLGDKRIMDFLGMNPLQADRDRQSAETLFQEATKSRQAKS